MRSSQNSPAIARLAGLYVNFFGTKVVITVAKIVDIRQAPLELQQAAFNLFIPSKQDI